MPPPPEAISCSPALPMNPLPLWLSGAVLAFGASAHSQESVPASAPVARNEIAARGAGSVLSFDELDVVLLLRHGRSQAGRATLQHLVEAGLLEVLATENGIRVTPDMVDERWDQLEEEIRKSGQTGGLETYLKQSKVNVAEFREHLRLAIVHEILARRGLGIPDSRPITGEQLQNWLNATLNERGLEQLPAPWKSGVMARCAGLEILVSDYLEQLRGDLPLEEIQTLCYQSLLAKRVAERMPDLTNETRAAALKDEIDRRRLKAAANPAYQGLSFEQVLEAQGVDASKLDQDPAIQVAAWAHLWVDRKYDDAALRELYGTERDRFDSLYGEAVETWVLYLRAAEFKNDLNPRDFNDATREALRIKETVTSFPQFQYEIRRSSEDRTTREKDGFWGWITSGTPKADAAARQEIFDALRTGRYDPASPEQDPAKRLFGPVRGTNGVLLVWLGQRRPAPTWQEMREHVHREQRRLFLDELLPKNAVRTWRDE